MNDERLYQFPESHLWNSSHYSLYICTSYLLFVFGLLTCFILDDTNLIYHIFCILFNDIQFRNQWQQQRQSVRLPLSVYLYLLSSFLNLLERTAASALPSPYGVWLLVVINNFHCRSPILIFLLILLSLPPCIRSPLSIASCYYYLPSSNKFRITIPIPISSFVSKFLLCRKQYMKGGGF